jgi:hypothetical protein
LPAVESSSTDASHPCSSGKKKKCTSTARRRQQ